MKNFIAISSLALLTCAPFSLPASYPTHEEAADHKQVGRIDIQVENLDPNNSFDTRTVLEKLKTKVGDPFTPAIFDTDLKTLAAQYDRVEPDLRVQSGQVLISLKVWLRPTIRSITWSGNTHISRSSLRKELGVKPEQTFNRGKFNKKFNKVKEYYVKKGYFESQLSYTLQPIPNTNQVDVLIDVVEGRAGIVDDIILSGFTSREKRKIFEMIYTKTYNFFTSWLTGHGILQEEAIEQDRLQILNLLHNEGYGDALVNLQITNAEKEGRVIITLTAERGALFRFNQVTFQGNSLFSDAEIEKMFQVHPDELYSPDKLRATMESIKDLYGRKGYIDTNVVFETEPVADQPLYNVHFDIEEGVQYKIGLIRVFGNAQTSTPVILRESLLTPGEMFDSVRLKATQERLQNVGFFKNVNVYSVRSQDDEELGSNYRDIYIEVEETQTAHAGLFFGFSSGNQLFGGLDFTETNFNYKGFAHLPKEGYSALRGNGEYAHAKITLGDRQRSYLLSWQNPYFHDTYWRVGFEAFLNHSRLQAKKYVIDSVGGSLFAAYPLTPYWTVRSKYRAQHGKTEIKPGAPKSEKRSNHKPTNTSAVSGALSFDSTDHIMKPHRGFRSLFEVEFAGLGGNLCFLKYLYQNSYYQHLWRNGVLKYRWDFEFIHPLGWSRKPSEIPKSERFFIGGQNSVRGFRDFDLGPHYGNGDPKGGISASVLSLEYNHEIFAILDGFLFIDAGAISEQKFALRQYQLTYGIGARIEVMNRVPITVGYGIPVNAKHRSQIQRFFFSMGGQF